MDTNHKSCLLPTYVRRTMHVDATFVASHAYMIKEITHGHAWHDNNR